MSALQAAALSALPGIRHAFFTRDGGVSDGVYESLNGGTGSNDAPDHVAENRARMAAALGVAPEHFLTAYQIHSPEVVVAETPWPQSAATRRRRSSPACRGSRSASRPPTAARCCSPTRRRA